MFIEHSQVVLNRRVPQLGLEPGDVGVVVHVHGNGEAYEVEFMSLDGRTIGVETIEGTDLRGATSSGIPHERLRVTA
jgi:hypothetical protein